MPSSPLDAATRRRGRAPSSPIIMTILALIRPPTPFVLPVSRVASFGRPTMRHPIDPSALLDSQEVLTRTLSSGSAPTTSRAFSGSLTQCPTGCVIPDQASNKHAQRAEPSHSQVSTRMSLWLCRSASSSTCSQSPFLSFHPCRPACRPRFCCGNCQTPLGPRSFLGLR